MVADIRQPTLELRELVNHIAKCLEREIKFMPNNTWEIVNTAITTFPNKQMLQKLTQADS